MGLGQRVVEEEVIEPVEREEVEIASLISTSSSIQDDPVVHEHQYCRTKVGISKSCEDKWCERASKHGLS